MAANRDITIIPTVVIILLLLATAVWSAEGKRTLFLENFDTLNRKMTDSGSVWYGYGHIRLRLDSTSISSDSMIWLREENIIHFYGRVEAYDSVQNIWAEQLSYYHQDSVLVGKGNVVLIHKQDSVRTESQMAEYDRAGDVVYLEGEPHLFLNYPDTANMVEITSEYLTFYANERTGEAENDVVITHQDTRATCGCAEFFQKDNLLTLMEEPHAVRESSEISGQLMNIIFSGAGVRQIDVFDEARALFVEDDDTTTGTLSGESELSGDYIRFYFSEDKIRKISAVGAARSEYYPSPDDTTGAGKNFVSGDTIFIFVDNRRINKIEIKGGAEGVYITEGEAPDSTTADSLALLSEDLSDTILADSTVAVSSETAPSDSTLAAIADTSLSADSLTAVQTPEDTIHYEGGLLEYFAADRIIRITGGASVRQGEVALDADKVDYDVPKRVVLARARVDTVDTNVKISPLVLKDGSEEILGSKLVFNVDTKKGKIEDATTQYENAYYRGEDLFKEDEKIFYVEDGRLSSCELEEPHFHFRSGKMKLIHNDRVIARPVVLYIETLPVMTIPYYIFPLKRGRHSGILPIKLGNFEQGNRFIGNLGYYWAASEFWDIQTSLDFHENVGITLNNLFRYNKRYTYDGNVRASYSRDREEFATGEFKRDRWRIWGNHAQTLPYEIDFKASGQFVSDKNYSTDYSTDPDERRNRNIISKANFHKKFGRSSLSLSFNHTNNLDDESRSSNLPTGSFSMPKLQPFGSGREVDGENIMSWYNHFYVSYRNSFGFSTSERKKTETFFIDDSTGVEYESRTWKDFGYLNHSVGISASQNVFKYLTINPNMNLTETWYYILKSDQAEEAGIPADRPYRRGAVSAGVSSNTNLYGTFPVNQFGLVALRHTITPSMGFTWSPAIIKNEAVRSYTGQGRGSSLQQKSLRFSVQNLFQAKIKSGETEKKLDLLRVSSSVSHNFEAKERKFSFLNTTLSSSLLRNINMNGNLSHDLYDKNNKLKWRSPSLRSFSISASFQARGSVADDYVRQGIGSDLIRDTLGMGQGSGLNTDLTGPGAGGRSGATDWNLNLKYYYNETRSFGQMTGKTHWVTVTFNLGLTKNWKLKYSQKYDFVRHQSIDKIIDLYRKIHCWEGHFYWIPSGSRQGYYFKINVIAIPDIKAEKSESGLRGALFNR